LTKATFKYVPQKGTSTNTQPDSTSNETKTNNNNSKNNVKKGDNYENSKASMPFPVLEPDIFYAAPILMSDAEVAAFIVSGYP
jgi:hypothetical protein